MKDSRLFGQAAIMRLAREYSVKRRFQIAFDIFALMVSFEAALILRLSFHSWVDQLPISVSFIPIIVAIGIITFWAIGFYRTLWRYASVHAVYVIAGSCFLVVAGSFVAINLLLSAKFSWPVFFTQWLVLTSLIGFSRMTIRVIRTIPQKNEYGERKNVLIFGAGDAGELIARDILHSVNHDLKVVGFIDDDPKKLKMSIHRLPIFGGRKIVGELVDQENIDEIIVAIPSISGGDIRRLLSDLRDQIDNRVKLLTLPPLTELIEGKPSLKQVRQFDVKDLLRRDPIELDTGKVVQMLRNKSVLVSGAGGSIGSEICRQVALCNPRQLIIFDISEANLYQINENLRNDFPDLNIVPVVGDISRRWHVESVFNENRPNIVLHAAAYKHVPLMEENPRIALTNNIVGTRVLAAVSSEYGVERFVMVSTDKAVRPTNIMGASKRICEMIVQLQPHKPGEMYCSVRFGNVMGSSGSVIPKFEAQIARGGPLTITDQEITRYFMLTSEAVQLVLQAATISTDYATYYLDMGDPIRIDDLARDMIQLHGLVPDKDIAIEYTGLRPGEKLYEELTHNGDSEPTSIEKIWRADLTFPDPDNFFYELDELLQNCYSMDEETLYSHVALLVPDYTPFKRLRPSMQLRATENSSAASFKRPKVSKSGLSWPVEVNVDAEMIGSWLIKELGDESDPHFYHQVARFIPSETIRALMTNVKSTAKVHGRKVPLPLIFKDTLERRIGCTWREFTLRINQQPNTISPPSE